MILKPLVGWNKERDMIRRNIGRDFLEKNNIKYSEPSMGHFKIESDIPIMYYPKTCRIVWQNPHQGQDSFYSTNPLFILKRLKDLI